MRKLFAIIVPLFLSAALFAHPEEPTPLAESNVSWHTVTIVDYKPGTVDKAKELIKKFETASISAGTPSPVIRWLGNGKYDIILTWELRNEPVKPEGNWSPEDVLWKKALAAQEGSVEAAKRLQDEYIALIANSVTKVSRKAK